MIILVCGCMFSGKTTEMLRRLERAHLAKKKVLLVRPEADTRGFLSHSKKDVSWLTQARTKNLCDLDVSSFEHIGIDEGQFYKDLKRFCLKNINKTIVISALHATSEAQMFKPITDIIPYCEKIIKLNAICVECGAEANYTHYKLGKKKKKVAVGGQNIYSALCAKCYFEKL